MIWLAFAAIILLLVRLLIVFINLGSRLYLRDGMPEDAPSVSVLIPARNEELNLPFLLDGLIKQEVQALEILVYDDDSSDRTAEVVLSYKKKYPNIKLLRGKSLPTGWTGKNHACFQLAQAARGSYFLFLDADVKLNPDLIRKSLYQARKNKLTLLSMFPVQEMRSLGEMLTVPSMNWILLSLLPMGLISRSLYPSLSAANGQFMLFRAREYRQHQFHRLVKDIHVEDIHIMRKVKQMGYRAQTLLSRGEISCRMYDSFRSGIAGFTRSVFAFFGGSALITILFTLFTTFGFFLVWLGLSMQWALVYLIISAVLRIGIFILSRQPAISLLFLTPLIQFSFLWMVITSLRLRFKGENTWKGRTITYKGI